MNVITACCENKNFSADTIIFYLIAGGFFGMPLGTAPPTICGAAAALVWIFSGKALKSIQNCFKKTWCRPVLLFMILPWPGLLYTADPGIDYAVKTHYWIYGFIVASIINGIKAEYFIKAFLIGLAVNAFIGFLQFSGVYPPTNGWYCGLGRGYSTLSAYLVLGILAASFYFKKSGDKKIRLYSVFLMTLFFFHLLILDGRTGYLTFFILSPLMIRNIFPKCNFLIISISCIVIISLMSLSPIVRDRVKLSIDQLKYHMNADPEEAWGREYTPNQDRFYMWNGAVRIFLDNPIIGTGTGAYQTELNKRNPDAPLMAHPHNDFLYIAASYGIAGIFAFIWLFFEIIRNGYRQRDNLSGYFVLSTGLITLISGLLNTQLLDAGMAFLLAVTAGFQEAFTSDGTN